MTEADEIKQKQMAEFRALRQWRCHSIFGVMTWEKGDPMGRPYED